MKFVRRTTDQEPSVNLTPLIDIVFLLLIFFMVSSRFIEEQDLALELPSAALAQPMSTQRSLALDITDTGGYRVAGEKSTASQLVALLQAQRAQYPDRALRVRADGNARHAAVVHALDAASQAGFERVEIATRREH
jgi:biopolymer transport protein ExbD